MNNNKIELKKKIEKMVFGLMIIYIIIVLLLACVKKYSIQKTDLTKGWTLYIDSKKVGENISINKRISDVKEGAELLFVKTIDKSKKITYPMIQGFYMDSEMKIYVDGHKICEKDYVKNILGKKYFEEEINTNCDNKELKIKIKIKDVGKQTYIGKLELIDEKSVLRTKFMENIEGIIVGAICLIFGMIVLAVTALIKDKNSDVKRFFWLAAMYICIGLFLYSRMDICAFIFSNNVISEIVLYSVIIGIIPCLYFIHLYLIKDDKNKKMLKTCFGMLVFGVVIMQGISSVVNIKFDSGKIYIIGIILGICGLLYIGIKDYKNASIIDRFFWNGMFLLYGIAMLTLITYFFVDYNVFTDICLNVMYNVAMGLLLIVIVNYSYKIKEYMDRITDDKILTTMAYTDPLTGIMNRNKYENVIKEIKENNIKRFTVVVFDLNNLKLINDKKGHDVGDAYIKTFAKVLRIGFEEEGFIARIGGDEFIAIIKNKYVEIEENIDAMQGILKDMMSVYVEEEVSFAYGVASSTKKRVLDIDDVIKAADEKMYVYKRKQKD